MAPSVEQSRYESSPRRSVVEANDHGRASQTLNQTILEAWSQGFLVGGLIVLGMIAIANMRKGVLLHKLILLEVRDSRPRRLPD